LGIVPTVVEAVVPGYLWRFRKAGQFAQGRGTEAEAGVPDLLAPESESTQSLPRPSRASGPAVGENAAGQGQMGSRWGTRG
ncbi:complex I NDUFA9 subunit family protein, partial [Bradyrhizobium sp. 149]|nr:complex I NDUFA9 subunit family protein [Bradyrhizobium sp. 149]